MSIVRWSGVLLVVAGLAGLIALLFGDAENVVPLLMDYRVFLVVCGCFVALAIIGVLLLFGKTDASGGPSR